MEIPCTLCVRLGNSLGVSFTLPSGKLVLRFRQRFLYVSTVSSQRLFYVSDNVDFTLPPTFLSIVLEAPITKRSLGDKTSLHVINVYSDKQQLSHNIGWPVTHIHICMRACRPAYSHVDIHNVSVTFSTRRCVTDGNCKETLLTSPRPTKCIPISLSLSLSLCIYIYIYIYVCAQFT